MLRYAPSDTRFRLERHDSLELQYPNGTQAQSIVRTAWVRLLVVGGTEVRLVLDSLRTASLPADSLKAFDGTAWTGALEEGRRIGTLTTTRRSTLADQLARPLLDDFLPALPAAGARSGATWRDSTTAPQRLAGAEVPVTEVTAYRATEAAKELTVAGDARVSAKGTSTTFGQAIDVAASGTRQRTWRLSPAGQLLGAEGSDSVALTLDVPSVGQTVPATQRSRYTVTRLGAAR